jgi:hypothetical protein
VIGGFEAQSIAVALENMIPTRPLTHDLFKNTLQSFDIVLQEVIINQLQEGVFYSKLVFVKEGKEFHIDSRTSDAIAMAVRYNAPIYTYNTIIDIAGVEIDDNLFADKPQKTTDGEEQKSKPIADLTNAALKALLDKALEREDYEKAAQIRDEMKKRNLE